MHVGGACLVAAEELRRACGGGDVLDCTLACVSASTVDDYVGDDFCDDGFWDVHLYCDAFDFDDGDCEGESVEVPVRNTTQCWGFDFDGQAQAPDGAFASVSAGSNHSCALAEGGTVQCWGSDTDGPASPPSGLFRSVSAGNRHSCGITIAGDAVCWGFNGFGESSPPSL